MTKIEFEPCSHRLSLVQGIYVIMQGDNLAATCNSLKLVHEWLYGVKYEEAHEVRIFISAVDDFDTDEVTYLIAMDMFSDEENDAGYNSYAERVELTGHELPWLEWWFDEFGRPEQHDYEKRVRRYNEINAPVRG